MDVLAFPLVVDHMDWLLVDNTSVGEKIDRKINWHLLCYQKWLTK